MNIKQEIEPAPFIFPVKIVHSFEIQVLNLVLFQSVTIMVTLYDENNIPIDNKMLTISGDDYLNWFNDDNYLIDYALNNLNFTKKYNFSAR